MVVRCLLTLVLSSSFCVFSSVASNASDKARCGDEVLLSRVDGRKTTGKTVQLTEEQIKLSEEVKKLIPNCPVCFLIQLPSCEGLCVVNEHGEASPLEFIDE